MAEGGKVTASGQRTAAVRQPADSKPTAPPAKSPRTARGELTRRKILDAARTEFGTRGFADTGITEITRTAKVALGTFYTYFDSKEALFAALVGLAFALFGVVLTLVTGNGYFDVLGTALIGLLLVAVAVTLAVETKSLLLGEAASPEAVQRIQRAIEDTPGVERIIHMKTLHMGPEEVLVAAKIAVGRAESAAAVAARPTMSVSLNPSNALGFKRASRRDKKLNELTPLQGRLPPLSSAR